MEPQVIPKEPYPKLNVKLLEIDRKNFQQLSLDDAIKKYGEPFEKGIYKIQDTEVSWAIRDSIFPNREFEKQEIKVLEAYWVRQAQSWYAVYYLKKEGVWQPIDLLIQV